VLRGAPHYGWHFPAKRFFARLLHHRTPVPVPGHISSSPVMRSLAGAMCLYRVCRGLRLSDEQGRGALSLDDGLVIAAILGEA